MKRFLFKNVIRFFEILKSFINLISGNNIHILLKYIHNMSIPLPTSSGGSTNCVSKCDLYDGDDSTACYCKGYVTATQKCMRRDDEMGNTCNGISPP